MERYSMALADKALDVAFYVGALKLCFKEQHVAVRTIDPDVKRKAYKVGAKMIDARRSSFPNPSLLMAAIKDVIEMGEDQCGRCAHCGSRASCVQNQL